LDAILTYGPAAQYGNSVGKPIGPDHKGREVMATGKALTVAGHMVRGDILNAMIPVVRNAHVIGYIWANQLTSTIKAELFAVARRIYLLLGIIYVITIGFVAGVLRGTFREVRDLIAGVRGINFDLTRAVPETKGEFHDVSTGINTFLGGLRNLIRGIRGSMDQSGQSIHSLEGIMEQTKDSVSAINGAAGKIKDTVLKQSDSAGRTAARINTITQTINLQNDTIQKQKESAEQSSQSLEALSADIDRIAGKAGESAAQCEALNKSVDAGRAVLGTRKETITHLSEQANSPFQANQAIRGIAALVAHLDGR
jgi:methyl-accepting chemotaxis protein